MNDSSFKLTRRRMLQTLGIGSAGFLFKDVLFQDLRAEAAGSSGKPPTIVILCYFSGGWDQLMALDPRPFGYGAGTNGVWPQPGSAIDPAYGDIVDTAQDVTSDGKTTKAIASYIASPEGQANGGRVKLAGTNIWCGPSLYDTVLATDPDVASSVCIVRGVNMGTLTHEVGRRYFITGKFPRGLQAAGSSLPTWVASLNGDTETDRARCGPIPNLTVGVETYNEGLPAFSSGLVVNSASEIVNVLRALNPEATTLQAARDAALRAYETQNDCLETQLDGTGLVSTLRSSRANALSMLGSNLYSLFSFPQTLPPTPDGAALGALYTQFGIDPASSSFGRDISGAKGQALIAARAITPNTSGVPVSTCVSIQLASGIDDHDSDWTMTHGQSLRSGFEALGRLIKYLKTTPDPLVDGQMLFARTQLLAFSEFARTPNVNARGGRDHHLASSCLMAGGGIKGGVVIGGTDDHDFGARPIDLTTGQALAPGTSGYTIRPSDVHATFLQAAGLAYTNISNQTPQLIKAALKHP